MHNENTHTGPSFSLLNRVARLVWNAVYIVLFKYSPRPFHAWRIMLLKVFGAKIGKGVHVYPKVNIWAPWNLEISDFAGIANGVILYAQGKIHIGKRVVISQGSHLCAGTHDFQDPGFPLITKPIYIKDFVWIAAEVFIHPGVSIGEGSVVGARSVVSKDMPVWMICAGFPCEPLKPRMSPDEIENFKKD